jgi:hypothetical protein
MNRRYAWRNLPAVREAWTSIDRPDRVALLDRFG